MTTKEIQLNVCFNIKALVSNDSVGYVKENDAIERVEKWVTEELYLGRPGDMLDITNGYGEVEVFDIEEIKAEVM